MSHLKKITQKRNFKNLLQKEVQCLVFLEMNQMNLSRWIQFKNEMKYVPVKFLQKKVIGSEFFVEQTGYKPHGSYCVIFCESLVILKQVLQIIDNFPQFLCVGGSYQKQFFSKLDLVQLVSKDKTLSYQLLCHGLTPTNVNHLNLPLIQLCKVLSLAAKPSVLSSL